MGWERVLVLAWAHILPDWRTTGKDRRELQPSLCLRHRGAMLAGLAEVQALAHWSQLISWGKHL